MLPTRLQPQTLILRLLFILILILGYSQSWSQCDGYDFDYLKELYEKTNGDNWSNKSGWAFIRDSIEPPNDCDLSILYGITMDTEGYVSEINLSNNNLTGTIPTEEYLPPSLTKINLSNNFIVGEIPNDFNDAPLIEIDYSNNQFSGSMPNDYDNLIEVINFSGNGLSEEIPDDLGDYTSLIILELGDNDNYGSAGIEGAIPLELGSLLNLTTLSLNDNNLSGCYAAELKNLCGVATNATISAGNNLIGPWETFCGSDKGTCYCNEDDFEILKALSEATTGTKWLDTTGWNPIINYATCPEGYDISDAVGISVNELYRVDSILLRNNKLTGALPLAWRGLEYTTYINLSKNLLAGEISMDFGSMSNLKDLRLHDNNLTGDIPVETWNFDSLEVLSLGQNALTGGIPEGLGEKANLRELWLEQNQLGGSIPASLGHLKDLTVLRINQNGMSGCFPTNLLHLCGQLTNFNINGGNNNFDDTWVNLCNSNSGLCSDCTETDILWSGAISDQWDNPLNWEYGCLPQSNGSVTIAYGESSVIPSSFTDTIMSMKVNNPTTEFIISSGAKLFIRNAGKPLGSIEAIENEGIIINNGELTIDSSYSDAIINRERIENNGLLEILNSSSSALGNYKTLINNNSILISQVEDEAIYNRDSIHNGLTGSIDINNVLNANGIENFGTTQDSSMLVNYGSIIISDVMGGDGIKSNRLSIIENKGDIKILGVDRDGIESEGRLSNESLIDISNITGNYGIDAESFGSQPSIFHNHSAGYITINNAGSSAGLNIEGIGRNEGTISVMSSPNDGINIRTIDKFVNSGMIEINSSSDYGIRCFNDSELNNTGIITINDSSERGLYLQQGSTYINKSLGELLISNSIEYGIFMSLNSTLMNLENGKITINNTTEIPLEVETGAVLEGYPTIEIND